MSLLAWLPRARAFDPQLLSGYGESSCEFLAQSMRHVEPELIKLTFQNCLVPAVLRDNDQTVPEHVEDELVNDERGCLRDGLLVHFHRRKYKEACT